MYKRLFFILLCAISISTSAQTGTIKILAVNDMHSSVQNFPKLAYVVDSIRKIYPDLLLISAGDNRTGDPINDIYPEPNWPMTFMMNELGFNISCLGNHEWDGGTQSLSSLIKKSKFSYICANAIAADSLDMRYKPFVTFKHGNIRITCLGLIEVGDNGYPACLPSKAEGFRFRPPMGIADQYRFLRDISDVYIIVSHMGLTQDKSLAKIYPEADLIIGGHSHDSVPGEMVNNVLITQAQSKLRFVSDITLEVQGGKVVSKTAKLIDLKDQKEDELYRELVQQFANNPVLNNVLAQSTTAFENRQELGCLMADAMREASGVDIAYINRGSVRYDTKPKGNFTVGDVLRLDPFGNTIITIEAKGSDIPDIIKTCIQSDPATEPPFMAGVKCTVHLGKTPQDIKKLEITLDNGKKLNKNKIYKISISSYLAQVSKLKEKYQLVDTQIVTSDAIMDYLKKQSIINYHGALRVTYKTEFDTKK